MADNLDNISVSMAQLINTHQPVFLQWDVRGKDKHPW